MIVHIYDEQNDLSIPETLIKKLTLEVITHEGWDCDEVALHFVSAEEICRLHSEYFGDPSLTDCITFPLAKGPGPHLLGDVFVCPKKAIEFATETGGNPTYEVILYVVHCLLHLMGYDDIEESDIARMRDSEQRHMNNLQSKNLLPKY